MTGTVKKCISVEYQMYVVGTFSILSFWGLIRSELLLDSCMVDVHDVADFDAVWLPWWRRAKVRAYTAKKSKKKYVPTTFLKTAVKAI